MNRPTGFMAVLIALALLAAACGNGTSDLLSAAEGAGEAAADPEDATPEPDPTPVAEATASPTSEPTATPAPTATPEPPATPTPEPVTTLVAVFSDGTLDFEGTEDNLFAEYGQGPETAVQAWFGAQGIVPAQVAEVHSETLGEIDESSKELLIPLMQTATIMACEVGAIGFNVDQLTNQFVDWNLQTQPGDPETLRVIATAVMTGAIIAADQFCATDSPSFASGEPQLPGVPPADSEVPGDDAGFVAQAAAAAGCTLSAPEEGFGAKLDYQASLVALGFIESFDEVEDVLPLESTNCSLSASSSLKFWRYTDASSALLSSEPILLGQSDSGSSCWAITGYFEYLIFGISAGGTSPNAVDAVNALAALDAPLVTSGGDCG